MRIQDCLFIKLHLDEVNFNYSSFHDSMCYWVTGTHRIDKTLIKLINLRQEGDAYESIG